MNGTALENHLKKFLENSSFIEEYVEVTNGAYSFSLSSSCPLPKGLPGGPRVFLLVRDETTYCLQCELGAYNKNPAYRDKIKELLFVTNTVFTHSKVDFLPEHNCFCILSYYDVLDGLPSDEALEIRIRNLIYDFALFYFTAKALLYGGDAKQAFLKVKMRMDDGLEPFENMDEWLPKRRSENNLPHKDPDDFDNMTIYFTGGPLW